MGKIFAEKSLAVVLMADRATPTVPGDYISKCKRSLAYTRG